MKIPRGITREHVLQAIKDLDTGVPHRFGTSRKYDLLFAGRRYPPKAVLGLALGHLLQRRDVPNTFSGGEVTNGLLRGLGFEIVNKTR